MVEADVNNYRKVYLIIDKISAVTEVCIVLREHIKGRPDQSGSDKEVGLGAGLGGRVRRNDSQMET